MGYDMTAERADKLARLTAEGRRCGGATRAPGGCAIRASHRITALVWTSGEDRAAGEPPQLDSRMTVCGRHLAPSMDEGTNVVPIRSERL